MCVVCVCVVFGVCVFVCVCVCSVKTILISSSAFYSMLLVDLLFSNLNNI